MTTMKLIGSAAAKFAALILGCAALCATTVHAGGFDGKPLTTNDWFDVGFSGVAANTVIAATSATGISSGAGSWTVVPTTGEAVVQGGTLSIDADDGEVLTLTPSALASSVSNETVAVKVKANVITSLDNPEDPPIAAFALYDNGTTVTPVAYVDGGWTNLVYANAADLTNAWFTLYIDFSNDNGQKSVRFSVQPDGGAVTVLKDSQDATWFASGSSSATKISSLSFSGSGFCQTISGDSYLEAVAQVNGVNYATFADAIAAADGQTITVLNYNSATMTAPEGWKFVTNNDVTTLVPCVFYVATNGNDANAGTSAAPFAHIQKAINVASDGDTIIVREGNYNVWCPTSDANNHTGRAHNLFVWKGVTIKGDGTVRLYSRQTVYNGTFDSRITVLITNTDGATLDGLTIYPIYYTSSISTGLSTVSGSVINEIEGDATLKLYYNQIVDTLNVYGGGTDTIIHNVTVKNCTIGDPAIDPYDWGSAIYFNGYNNNRAQLSGGYCVSNNVFYGGVCICEDAGFNAAALGEDCSIVDNVFYDSIILNGVRNTGWNDYSMSSFPAVTGNVFNNAHYAISDTAGTSYWYCVVSRDSSAASYVLTQNQLDYISANNSIGGELAGLNKGTVVSSNSSQYFSAMYVYVTPSAGVAEVSSANALKVAMSQTDVDAITYDATLTDLTAYLAEYVADGSYALETEGGVCTATKQVAGPENAAAYVVHDNTTNYYFRFSYALSAASSGDTIVLLKDASSSSTTDINKSLTLDLNGCTFTDTSSWGFYVYSGCTLTIENGTMENANGYLINPGRNATVIMNDVAVSNTLGNTSKVICFDYAGEQNSTVTVNSGTWTCSGNFSNSSLATENIIVGGTFDFDPTAFVAEGSTVTNNGNGTWTVTVPTPVAQIIVDGVDGDTYTSIEAATIYAYSNLTGNVTIKLLSDTTEIAALWQKEGLNLTIDGDGKTLTGQLLVYGTEPMNSSSVRTDTLTIKGIDFVGAQSNLIHSSLNGFVTLTYDTSKGKGQLDGVSNYHHAHNVTITNCTFTGVEDVVSSMNVVGVKSLANALDEITMVDLTGAKLHSLAQLFDATNVVISGCSLSNSKNGLNLNLTRNGTSVISDTSIAAIDSEAYGVRLQGSGYGVVRLLSGVTIDAAEALVAGNTSEQVPLNNGNFLVEDGFYKGVLTQKVANCTFYITGGYFSEVPAAAFIAPGYTVIDNTDPATKDAYPYMVGVVPPVAAVITDNGATTNTYATFAAAISAARTNGGTVALLADIEEAGGTSLGYNMSDIVLDGQGHTISCACGVLFSGTNVVVSNLKVEMGASGNHIMTVNSGTFTGCEFVGATGVQSANYADDKSGVAKTLTFSNCTFRDFTTDTAVINVDETDVNSRLVVDHCTFSNTVRVTILQRADTFTNNTITDFDKFTVNNSNVVVNNNTFDKGARSGVMNFYNKPAEITGNDFSTAGEFKNKGTSIMTADEPLVLVDNTWGDYDKSSLPVGIIAEFPAYDVWVGGTLINEGNAADVFGDGKVSYDDATKTLTLNGYTYSGAGYVFNGSAGAAVYAAEDLSVVVAGTTSLEATYGIVGAGNLTITGTGADPTLNITAGTAANNAAIKMTAGGDAVLTGLRMALLGDRGIDNNEASEGTNTLVMTDCRVEFLEGTVRSINVYNTTAGASLKILASDLEGYGLMNSYANNGDALFYMDEHSSLDLTGTYCIQTMSTLGDAVLTFDGSVVDFISDTSGTGSAAINVGTSGSGKTAALNIQNKAIITSYGGLAGLSCWTWCNDDGHANMTISDDSYVDVTATGMGIQVYPYKSGVARLEISDSEVSATGKFGIAMSCDVQYNVVGSYEYYQTNSTVTATSNSGNGYAMMMRTNTKDKVNTAGTTDFTVIGGSFTANGAVYANTEGGGSTATMSDAVVTIDAHDKSLYGLVVDTLNIDSGSYNILGYNGVYNFYVQTGNITGGIFSDYVETYCAPEFVCVDNTDESTSDDYPYAVVRAVASITVDDETDYFATFEDAIDLWEEGYTITVIGYDSATMVAPEGWEFSTDTSVEPPVTTLVRSAVYVAQIGETKYETLQAAIADAVDGDTIELLCDIELDAKVSLTKTGTYVIDGKGFTISMADGANFAATSNGAFILGIDGGGSAADIAVKNYTLKNLTVTGFNSEFIRCEGCTLTLDNCDFTKNDVTTDAGRGKHLIRIAYSTVTFQGCTITENTASDYGVVYIDENLNNIRIDNCLVASNTVSATAIIDVAHSESVMIADCSFIGNTVNSSNNGAVIYLGSKGDSTDNGGDCVGCLFKDNVVNYSTTTGYDDRVRVAGAIFTWAYGENPGIISGNAFVNNSVVKQNANYLNCYAKSIFSGGKYNAQDLAGNYFGCSAPVIAQDNIASSGNDIYAEESTYTVTASSFAYSYTLNADNYGVTVVLGKMVTFELDETPPTGAAKPSDGAYAVDSALPPATCTDADKSFAGWKVKDSDPAVIVAVVPADAASPIALVATWIGTKTVEVTESETSVAINVTDDWISKNVEKASETATTEEIQAALEKEDANGLPAWQNYVLGQDPNASVAADAAQGAVDAMPVVSTVTPQTVDTGFKVEYRVDEVNADGSAKTGGEGTLQDTPALTVDLTELTPENNVAYYKTVAVITSTDPNKDVTVTVESTNTIGVLMVESGAKTTAIAVPWESLGGGDISVSNIVRTANLTPGDELMAYDKSTDKYKVWTLSDDKTWEPSLTSTSDSTTLADEADAYKVPRGSAVWLKRKDTTQPIYLVGEVADAEKVPVALDAGTSGSPSWNLVGSSGTEPVDVTALLGENHDDKVSVPTAYVPKNYEYIEGKGWGYWDSETYAHTNKAGRVSMRVRDVFVTDDKYIPAGTGFWYQNSGTAKDIDL